ncbi:hypothetical protein B0H13DRAFT_2335647 [Mycena leptocephala]|nr:hypothetical protein B0H13DRAFT_2335647 [Mycena leptocephala]
MSKRRVAGLKPRKDSDTYRPGLTAAEKKENHRKAAAAYYARHPEIKEKNRLSLQRRRAAVKAKRRQWDPPRKGKALSSQLGDGPGRRSPSVDLNLISDEMLNGPVVFKDPRGAPTSVDEDSDFRRMDAGRRVRTETSERNAAPESTPQTPSPDERVAIAVLAAMGGHISSEDDSIVRMANLLSSHGDSVEHAQPARTSAHPSSRVRALLTTVAKLNEGALTAPTEIERRKWVRKTFGFWGHYLQYRQFNTIDDWRSRVSELAG